MKPTNNQKRTPQYSTEPVDVISVKGALFPNIANNDESSVLENLNKYHGFVEVYLDKSTGELKLGEPYMTEDEKPKRVERDTYAYKHLGTATIQFAMPFKRVPKFEIGDEVLIFGEIPARILGYDTNKQEYDIIIHGEPHPIYAKYDFDPGYHKVSFSLNGQIIKKPIQEAE